MIVAVLVLTWIGVTAESPKPPSCDTQRREAQALLTPWLDAQRAYAQKRGEFAGSLELLAREGLAPRMTYTSRFNAQVELSWATQNALSLYGRLENVDADSWIDSWIMTEDGRLYSYSGKCKHADDKEVERPDDAQLYWARIDDTPIVFSKNEPLSSHFVSRADDVEREFLRAHLKKLGVASEVTSSKTATLSALRRIFAAMPDVADVSDWGDDWVNGALIETACFVRESYDSRMSEKERGADSNKAAQRALQLTKKLGAPRVIWAAQDEAKVSTKKVSARDIRNFASLRPGVIGEVIVDDSGYWKPSCVRSVVTVCKTNVDKRVCESIATDASTKSNTKPTKWRGFDAHPQREAARRAQLLVASPSSSPAGATETATALTMSPEIRADLVLVLTRAEKALAEQQKNERPLPIEVRALREWIVGIEQPDGSVRSAADVLAPALLQQRVTSSEAQDALSEWAWNIVVEKAGRKAEWEEAKREWTQERKQRLKNAHAHEGESDEHALDALRRAFVERSFPDAALTEAFFTGNVGIAMDVQRYQRAKPLHVIRRACLRDLMSTAVVNGDKETDAWVKTVERIRAQALAAGTDEKARLATFRSAAKNAKLDVFEHVAEKASFDEEARRTAELYEAFSGRVPRPPELCVDETIASCPTYDECPADARERLLTHSRRRSMFIAEPDRWLEDAGVVMAGRRYSGPHVLGSDKILRGARDNDVVVRIGAATIRYGQLRPQEYVGRVEGEREMRKALKDLVDDLAAAEHAAQLAKRAASTNTKWSNMIAAASGAGSGAELIIGDMHDGGNAMKTLWLETPPVALDDPEVTKLVDDDLAYSAASSFACHRSQYFKLKPSGGACEPISLAKKAQAAPAAQRTRMLLACDATPDSASTQCGARSSFEGRETLERIDRDASEVHEPEKGYPLKSVVMTTAAFKDIGKEQMQALRRQWAAAELRSLRAAKTLWKEHRAVIRAAQVPDDPSLAWIREELAELGEDR